eukprot:TRINITY_DN22603_c0_g1_i1.p1 TRINITY_DN22603_c0_g1~~TRINITY_DN22603_c0_g1_i1.p1  ORF type:complete len:887 (-),score=225.04 TRINITY_DN22603_c0_g1_i1:210-2870(-)
MASSSCYATAGKKLRGPVPAESAAVQRHEAKAAFRVRVARQPRGGSSSSSNVSAPPAQRSTPESDWGGFWSSGLFLATSSLSPSPVTGRPKSTTGGLLGDSDEDSYDDGAGEEVARNDVAAVFGRIWEFAKSSKIGSGTQYLFTSSVKDEDLSALCERPMPRITAAAAVSGLAFGLRIATKSGFGSAAPELTGMVSSVLAAGGVVACVMAAEAEEAPNTVNVQPWVLVALAAFCGGICPLPLCPLTRAAMAGVGGPVKLALPGIIGSIAIFEIGHRYYARIDPQSLNMLTELEAAWREGSGNAASSNRPPLLQRVSKHWLRHFTPSSANDRGIGSMYFAATMVVTFFAVQLDLSMTAWRKTFFNVLEARNLPGMHHLMWDFAPIAVASTLAGIYTGYLSTMWDLRWREEITHDFMKMWLEKKSYYYVRFVFPEQNPDEAIDNFDQRLVQDTALFAGASRGLLCSFGEALFRLAIFGPALISIAPSPLIWQTCLGISVVSSLLTHYVGHPLTSRGAALQRAEADFRAALLRLRIFAEDIALQQGAAAEGALAVRHLEHVKAATYLFARGTMNLNSFTSAYGLVGGVLPFLVLVPSYFHGDISLGLMFQIESIMGGVQQSLGFFVGSYSDIADWRASAERLLALEAVMEELPDRIADGDGNPQQGFSLVAEDVTLVTASGATVLEEASFEWHSEQRIVVSGAAGSGKSALLRMLAGAWPPPVAGVVRPGAPGIGILFVPRSGFLLPQRAALRRCLAYPEAESPEDENLEEALASCNLKHLIEQLDVEADWSTTLPLVDRQRLVFARMLARWPKGVRWLLLDEVDSALDPVGALQLHETLAERVPPETGLCIITCHREVGHRVGWRRFHLNSTLHILEEEEEDVGGLMM